MWPIGPEFGKEPLPSSFFISPSHSRSRSHLPRIHIQLSHVQLSLIQPWFHLTGLDQLTPTVLITRESVCPRDSLLPLFCACFHGFCFSLLLQVLTGCLHMQLHIHPLFDLVFGTFVSIVTAIHLTSMMKNLLVAIGSIQTSSKISVTGCSRPVIIVFLKGRYARGFSNLRV